MPKTALTKGQENLLRSYGIKPNAGDVDAMLAAHKRFVDSLPTPVAKPARARRKTVTTQQAASAVEHYLSSLAV